MTLGARQTFTPLCKAAIPQGHAVARRGMVSAPIPLSIRMDSLMVKCVIAALIYFVPQDVVFLGGLLTNWRATSNSIASPQWHNDPDEALEAFKAKKGLDSVAVSKGRTYYVSMK